jgi:hypothetical protein
MKQFKWILAVVGVLFLAACTAMSLYALSEAKKEAAK